MEQSSELTSVQKLMLKKQQQDEMLVKKVTQEVLQEELQKLRGDCQSLCEKELNTIGNAIQSLLQKGISSLDELTAQEIQKIEIMVEDHQARLSAVLDRIYKGSESAVSSRITPIVDDLKKAREESDRATASLRALEKQAVSAAKREKRRWFMLVLSLLTVFTCIFAGSWGLTRYLSSEIQSKVEAISTLEQTKQALEKKTYGLSLKHYQEGTFLILPPGASSSFKIGGQDAVKLSVR